MTVKRLDEYSKQAHSHLHFLQRQDRDKIINGSAIDVQEVGRSREVSLLKQVLLLTARGLTDAWRVPLKIFAMVFLSVFQAFLMVTVF
jgi:hypothetical protein